MFLSFWARGSMRGFGYLGSSFRVDLAVGLLKAWLFGKDLR